MFIQPGDPDAETSQRFQSLEPGKMEAMLAERGLLWAFLPQDFPGSEPGERSFPWRNWRRGNFPEAVSEGVRENREQVRATSPLGTGHGRRAHLAQGRHRASSVLAPRATVPRLVLSEGGQRQLLLGENGLGI